MGNRLQLQSDLETLIGNTNVYFQPPESKKIDYPCIIYSRNLEGVQFADDKPYSRKIRYQVVVIDRDPDSIIPEKIAGLPTCSFERHYTADNLNHDVYNIYY